jgi:hypothetical protein
MDLSSTRASLRSLFTTMISHPAAARHRYELGKRQRVKQQAAWPHRQPRAVSSYGAVQVGHEVNRVWQNSFDWWDWFVNHT